MDREVLDANAGAEQAAQQLRVAAQGGQLEAVRQLLQEDAFCASSADGTDTEGRTALHLAALNRHLEIVQALLAHRAAVTADAEGETPLHHAAFSGRAAIVAELLAARASRTAENANGRTPLDYAQLKGSKEVLALLTAEPLVDEETASQEHPPPLLNILHFAIRQRPAVVEGADEISYHGHIKLGAAICYISFPGKYKAGWDALIAGLHGSSVACVFLCAAQDGLGQHAVDPDDPRGRCYCHRIYGERTYKEFGYLHFVKKKRTDCTDEEIRKIEEKAKAMNGVVVFADATPEERMEKEMEAQELWERHQRTASWGCAWYHVWLARVKQAVADGQRLKVVFFPGEVGLGKVTMRELASANLWDGIGCGGSQKCEIATIEAMRQLTGDPRWDYEGVDVGDFLLEQFRVGDHVEALDGQRWCQGRILEAPKEDLQKDQKPTWKIQCNWSSKEFLSEHIRPVTAETDGLQRLLEAFVDPSLQRVLERLSGLKLQAVQASDGRRSMAVQVKIENVREAQLLRDQVLSGELESVVNEVLSRHSTLKCFPWEIGLDKTAFFELYERTLMSLSDLTAHQQEKLEELESVENPVIHLSAPAGAGKTFVAVMHVLKRLEATGDGERRHLVLYVAPNKALLFHFLRWFMVFASTKTVRWRQHLARIVVMCQPYQKCMKPTITETRIQLDPVEASSEEFLLVVMDEAHHMFCSQTDLAQQEMLQKIPAQQKLLLSDVSQSDGSQKDLTFDRFFPDRYQVALSQVVRSTQRIVAGARAFQLSAADAVKSSSLGTDGPPVKSFIFEVEGKEGNASREEIMMHYVKYTMDAFWHLMQTFSTLSFDRRLSLLVPDERFREDFQRLLDLELQKEFPHRRFQLVTCEESLSYLPSHMMAVNAEVYAGERIVLDTIENAKGLEQLIVISIGLDGGQDGDRLTRARLYQGITRAQLVALVVNEFVEDGLLAFLSKVKLKGAQRFQPKAAFAEIRTDAAAALVASPPKKVSAEAPPLAVSAARPVPEEVLPIPATARTTGGSAAETSKELPPRRSSVWDTESNALGAGARAVAGRGLRFDPMESMLEAYQRAVTLMELELIRDAARSLKEAEDVNFYQFNQEHVLSKTAPPDGIVLRGVRAPPQVAQSLLRNRRGRRFRSSVHVTREIVQMDAQRLRSGAVGTTQGAEVMADGRLAVSVDVTHGSFVAGDGLFIDSIAVGGPEEIDLTGSISYKEFLSPKPCIAQWYCCHWWGESLDSFVSSCQTHAQLRRRGSPGSAGGYWVAAFAMRQHELREELGPDLKESPFYDALRLADGILLTVDSEEVFRRTWCHYELYAGSDLKHLDVVCNGAMLSRTGLPGESMVAKQLREKGFDWELLLKGLTMNCEASRATVLADRRMFAAIFDQEGTLKVDETVCSTFALLAWPQAVKRGLVSTQLIETVASDVNREALELSLAHLQEFQDPGMLQLAQSLPPNLTKLKLGLEGCHELTDQGVKALANRWGTKLKHLYLDFVGCGKLTDASLSVLAQNLPPTLTDLELHMAGCVLVGPPGMEHLKKHWPKSVKVFRASFKATKLNRNFMTLQDLEDYWRES